MDPNDDTPDRRGWAPGFVRGFELASARYADALRRRLLAADFVAAGWNVGDVEAFVAAIAEDADRVRPSR